MIIHWPQYNAFMVDDQETEGRRRRQRRWKGAKGATSSHPGPSGVNGLICDLVSIGSHPAWEPIEKVPHKLCPLSLGWKM